MLLMNPIKAKDAGTAAEYFVQSDGGYYLDGTELRREWGGKGAPMLGLDGRPEFHQLDRMLKGLHPLTGEQLTARLADDRLAGWDFTARLPKNVTGAIERGDERIMPLVNRMAKETMDEVEGMSTTRVRKDGQDTDRVTGNMVWAMVEHPEGRPTKEDGKSDWDRHLHFLVLNHTWDKDEQAWKALKVHDIFLLRKWFSHRFDLRMSAALAELGYELETELKPGKRGGMEYHTWDIKAAPGHEKEMQSGKDKMCRRHQDIKEKENSIVAAMKERDPDAPDELSAVAQYKLSRTTRLGKVKDMTLDDLRAYWDSRLTVGEKAAIDATIERAREGLNGKPESKAAAAMEYAIAHEFQRNSVLDYRRLLITAMEQCMGGATPEELDAEAKRQGLLFCGNECSTQPVLDQEQRIIGFAREGRGTCRPLARTVHEGLDGLSDEQQAAVRHVWQSTDKVMLIRGGAGVGKTTAMKPALAKLGAPVVLLAPSAQASRNTLRKEAAKDETAAAAFREADTVAAFLGDKERQETIKNGGVIWVDEAGMLPIDDLEQLCGVAKALNARVVLQGDPSQHRAVDRDGNMLEVLESHAGLPVAKLTKIQRQWGEYAGIVADIRDKQFERADARMRKRGWVVEGEGHAALVAEYARAITETHRDGTPKSIIVIDPTHKDGDRLTEELRQLRKDKGLIVGPEKTFSRLVQVDMTNAQKGDARQYGGDEIIQIFKNTGRFKAGQRIGVAELLPELGTLNSKRFAAFRREDVKFAVGDAIRITNNGYDVTRKHRLDNGRIDTIKRFNRDGGIELANGWAVSPDFAHFKHGLVETSPSTQSKTEDIVLTSLNKASLPAMSARQAYVTISRGRSRGMVFTDMGQDALLAAIARDDSRKSATELFYPKPRPAAAARVAEPERMRTFMEKVRSVYRQLQRKAAAVVRERFQQREMGYAR